MQLDVVERDVPQHPRMQQRLVDYRRPSWEREKYSNSWYQGDMLRRMKLPKSRVSLTISKSLRHKPSLGTGVVSALDFDHLNIRESVLWAIEPIKDIQVFEITGAPAKLELIIGNTSVK